MQSRKRSRDHDERTISFESLPVARARSGRPADDHIQGSCRCDDDVLAYEVEFEPPLIACVVSSADYSFAALRATRECVIAVPALELAPKVAKVGNCSGRDVEKFAKFGLTSAPAERVVAPLVAECFANLECKVADTRLVNKYNLFVLEVLKAWADPAQKNPKTIHHHGYGRFAVDGEMIKLKSRMR
jgi:flavin reductase (DIM6/NTAB) family NADH-FMN oxidoreductase RutF